MKAETKKEFAYKGAGFPVMLLEFPFRTLQGDEVLDVDMDQLDLAIAFAVLRKPAPLTGNEIRFLRTILTLSLQNFGKELGVTAPAIKKWEDLKDKNMRSITNDFAIRNFVAKRLSFEHERHVDFVVHRSILEASDFWKPESMQIPFHLMKEVRRKSVEWGKDS